MLTHTQVILLLRAISHVGRFVFVLIIVINIFRIKDPLENIPSLFRDKVYNSLQVIKDCPNKTNKYFIIMLISKFFQLLIWKQAIKSGQI